MKKLVIDSAGLVVNAIEAAPDFPAPKAHTFAPNSDGDIGDTWTGTVWKRKPAPVLTAQEISEMSARAVEGIKDEAQRRIFLIAPATQQANMQRVGLEILQALILSGSLTPAQQATSDELNMASAQIDAIRAASNRLEAMTPVPQDYANDKYWI